MKALANFSVTVEEPPCLALPFKRIRQHIRSGSIFLEGDDGKEYTARLFIRSQSSENIYVAEGWSRFERAQGIHEGDVLLCKLLEGPKLKISVAEKSGRQNAQCYTDSSSSTKPIFKKRKVEMQDSDSGSDSESKVLKKRRRGIQKASRNITHSTEYSRGHVLKDLNSESESGSQSSIWEIKKKNAEARSWRKIERHSKKERQSLKKKAQPVAEAESSKRKKVPTEARFSEKNLVIDLDSELRSQCSLLEKGKKIARSCVLKQQHQSLSKKKAAEPQSSQQKQVLAQIHVLASKICNPHHILELTTKNMHQKAAVSKEFALHVNAANGNHVKLMVSEGSYTKVKWMNITKFKGFGKGWVDFLGTHGLRLGDYVVLELIGEKEIAVHLFYLASQSADQKKHQKINEEHGSKADDSPKQEKHEQMKPTSKAQSRKHEEMKPVKHEERSSSYKICKTEPCTCSSSYSELEEMPFRPIAKYSRYCNFS